MSHSYVYFLTLWSVYMLYWWGMSRRVKQAEQTEPMPTRLARLVILLGAAALLLLPGIPLPLLSDRFVPPGAWCAWAGLALTAGGLAFSAWGRHSLGKNWSQAVTLKEDHELITSGPYAVVRHPIYSGLLLAIAGCALAVGEWRGVLAALLVFGVLWIKLRLEEKWMRAHFGAAYEAYSRRVRLI